ncbi:hypothetical protein KY284_020536 [Solanum tuberosum]|nr:hypothetical protein KY284_020536 [Solanum tuberosum]
MSRLSENKPQEKRDKHTGKWARTPSLGQAQVRGNVPGGNVPQPILGALVARGTPIASTPTLQHRCQAWRARGQCSATPFGRTSSARRPHRYMFDEYVDEGQLLEEFPHIHAQVRALGLHYIFVDQGKCNLSLVREFYVNWNTHHVRWNQGLICNNRVQFSVEALNEFLAAPYCDHSDFQAMIDQPPYRDIRHTLCRVNSVSRWDRVWDTGRHSTFHYAHLNLEACIWLKIVSNTLLSCKHTTDVTRERVVLLYRLMKGLPVNAGVVLSLITRYLYALEIEEEVHDVSPPRAPHLVYCLVDVTRTKVHDQSQGKMLSTVDRQAHDDSWIGRMFGMAKLQLRIGGHPVTEDEIETLVECYLLMDRAMYMCWMGSTFQEPIDDDDATANEEDGSEEDDSDDVGPSDDDMDAGDGVGDATSMAVDFFTNVVTS